MKYSLHRPGILKYNLKSYAIRTFPDLETAILNVKMKLHCYHLMVEGGDSGLLLMVC